MPKKYGDIENHNNSQLKWSRPDIIIQCIIIIIIIQKHSYLEPNMVTENLNNSESWGVPRTVFIQIHNSDYEPQ